MKAMEKTRSTGQKKDGQQSKPPSQKPQQESEQRGGAPETIAAMKGYVEEVRNSLRSLSKLELRLLELSFHEGQSQSDLARMLRIPLGTIKGKMRRGIQKLRQSLAPEGV
jgi:RNA polymerase sigma-70 factor (ECF subfamily)